MPEPLVFSGFPDILNEANEYMIGHKDDDGPMPPAYGGTDGDTPSSRGTPVRRWNSGRSWMSASTVKDMAGLRKSLLSLTMKAA